MHRTIRLDDMRLFATLAEVKSVTGAARVLGMPKQTVSRRLAELEAALGVPLMHRTTRKLHLTEAGGAYAQRCGEVVRLSDEANRAVSEAHDEPTGTLRITADPVFGEAFLTDLVIEYAQTFPAVGLDVVLTRRKVDLVEEGFDVAFRIGDVDHPALTAHRLGPARVRYCASPAYLKARGRPHAPADLAAHDCLVVTDGTPVRWPFRGKKGLTLLPVRGRLTLTSFAMARAAAVAGLGVGIFPEFACAADVAKRRLRPVLEEHTVAVGSVWLLQQTRRYLTPRVRAFAELATRRIGDVERGALR